MEESETRGRARRARRVKRDQRSEDRAKNVDFRLEIADMGYENEEQGVRSRNLEFRRIPVQGARQDVIWLRRQCALLSLSHYVVELIDHRYQHALDMVINLLDDLMTVVRPNKGPACGPEWSGASAKK